MESPRQLDPAPLATETDDPAQRSPDDAASARHGADEPPTGRTLWGEPLFRLIAIAVALFAIAGTIAGTAAVRVHGISIFDESTHIDYAYQVAHGHIPAKGSIIAPAIREELVCRGPASRQRVLKHCGEHNPPAKLFVIGAENYNFGHPPVYYAITGALARAANAATSGHHFILFARLVGILWLFAAMLVLYVAMCRFAVRWPIAVSAAVMLACSPAIFYPAATVTNDAAAALAGSLAVLCLARITVQNKLGWKLPTLLAALAAGTKILNALPFLAVVAVVLFLALRSWRLDRARAVELLKIAVGVVVGILVVYLGWKLFQDHRGDPNWVSPIAGVSSKAVHGAPFDELFSTSFTSLSLMATGYVPPQLSNSWLAILLRLWGAVGIGATVALLAIHQRWTPRFILAACTIVGIFIVPWVVELQAYSTNGHYFPGVVSRYATSFVPFVLAAMAVAADDKRLTKWIASFATVCLGVALYTVFVAP